MGPRKCDIMPEFSHSQKYEEQDPSSAIYLNLTPNPKGFSEEIRRAEKGLCMCDDVSVRNWHYHLLLSYEIYGVSIINKIDRISHNCVPSKILLLYKSSVNLSLGCRYLS